MIARHISNIYHILFFKGAKQIHSLSDLKTFQDECLVLSGQKAKSLANRYWNG